GLEFHPRISVLDEPFVNDPAIDCLDAGAGEFVVQPDALPRLTVHSMPLAISLDRWVSPQSKPQALTRGQPEPEFLDFGLGLLAEKPIEGVVPLWLRLALHQDDPPPTRAFRLNAEEDTGLSSPIRIESCHDRLVQEIGPGQRSAGVWVDGINRELA